ncbi:MAG TPA: helicase C-terminal domain-containing protein, partial [Myxococcota bacterium]|nr:helicase C-terminal domain-containing protein [Myxococcota bacterium]
LLLARTIHSFVRALDGAGEETVALAGPSHLRLFCRDPARILAPRFARFAATICLSATLRPFDIFRDRCGLPPNRLRMLEADPFFPPEHRLVVAVPGISTAWKDRTRDQAAVTAVVQDCIEAVPGNVAVYFSSFQQLEDVLEGLDLRGRMLLRQGPSMGEEDRERLLRALAEPLPTHRVLLGVLGGIFAEGVDLPGALAAVIIVGPSLPPPGLDRKLQQAWLEERYGDGFERTFVAPGLSRVVQAAPAARATARSTSTGARRGTGSSSASRVSEERRRAPRRPSAPLRQTFGQVVGQGGDRADLRHGRLHVVGDAVEPHRARRTVAALVGDEGRARIPIARLA